MSKKRTKKGGRIKPATLPKGPSGRPLCRYCLIKEVGKGRRTFCSKECVHEHRVRTDVTYVRDQVFLRDRGVCAICKKDMERLRLILERMSRQERDAHKMAWGMQHRRTLWDADHIVPVIEGGGECGLENFRTLCFECHRKETAALAARRATGKKQEKRLLSTANPLFLV